VADYTGWIIDTLYLLPQLCKKYKYNNLCKTACGLIFSSEVANCKQLVGFNCNCN